MQHTAFNIFKVYTTRVIGLLTTYKQSPYSRIDVFGKSQGKAYASTEIHAGKEVQSFMLNFSEPTGYRLYFWNYKVYKYFSSEYSEGPLLSHFSVKSRHYLTYAELCLSSYQKCAVHNSCIVLQSLEISRSWMLIKDSWEKFELKINYEIVVEDRIHDMYKQPWYIQAQSGPKESSPES